MSLVGLYYAAVIWPTYHIYKPSIMTLAGTLIPRKRVP